jgi:hypothetical protein
VEEVYSDKYLDKVPEELRESEIQALGVDEGKTSLALINTLRVPDGYHSSRGEWSPDVNTPTRLTNNQCVVTLVEATGDMLAPIYVGDASWEQSEVSLPPGYKEVDPSYQSEYINSLIDQYRCIPIHRWRKFVVMHQREGHLEGMIQRVTNRQLRRIRYDKLQGLEVLPHDGV